MANLLSVSEILLNPWLHIFCDLFCLGQTLSSKPCLILTMCTSTGSCLMLKLLIAVCSIFISIPEQIFLTFLFCWRYLFAANVLWGMCKICTANTSNTSNIHLSYVQILQTSEHFSLSNQQMGSSHEGLCTRKCSPNSLQMIHPADISLYLFSVISLFVCTHQCWPNSFQMIHWTGCSGAKTTMLSTGACCKG